MFKANFKGQIPLPLTQLAQLQGNNFQLLDGDEKRLFAKAEASFFSQSLLELRRLGPMVFELTDPDGELIGNASMSNFEVVRGTNSISVVNATMFKTRTNGKSLRRILSGVAQGFDQELVLRGPVDGCPLFMQHIVVQQAFRVKGLSDLRTNYIRMGLINVAAAEGHKPGGGKCPLVQFQQQC